MSEQPPPSSGQIIVYQTDAGHAAIRIRLDGETLWMTQNQLAELYQTTKQNISLHVQNIYDENELRREATVKEYLTVQQEGTRAVHRQLEYYNLDMIIAVGYRVRSGVATRFRQWATERLREYLIKGFVLDDERLKGHDRLTDYFDELLARIREIRASEARVYQRIREIFSLATDYEEGTQTTQIFFATMQNKMHYAATGLTAAEIIKRRADAQQANMGLTNWSGSRVLKRDVLIAKNYLNNSEIDTLNRITVMFLDQAEFRAQRRQDIRMVDWTAFLDKFLRDTELPVLDNAGTISHEDASTWAQSQYDQFAQRRRVENEAAAESRYIEDLNDAAKSLEQQRHSLAPKSQKKKKQGKNANPDSHDKNGT